METLLHPEMIYFVTKQCSREWKLDNNWTIFHSLVFIMEGSADYEVDGHYFHAQSGDVILIEPGSLRNATTRGMSCVGIDFQLLKGEKLDLPLVFSYGNLEELNLIFLDLKFEWLQKKPGFMLKSQALLMLLLHKLIYERKEGPKNAHVEVMKRYIMKNFRENITVKMVADDVGLSPVYCGALFKKVEALSISEFLNQVRINKAISLLETGEYSIGEIADETGFMDIYYFSNTFKKTVGVSPSAYKNSHNLKMAAG